MKEPGRIIFAIAVLIGLSVNGYFIGRSLERFKKEDRFISVKGFSEREVKSDFAVWTIKTRITTNDLLEGSKVTESNKNKIINFLLDKGIGQEEIIQQDLKVTDKLARDWGTNEMGAYRYIIENAIQVRSANVDEVQNVSRMTDELLKAGVVITNAQDYQPSVQYLFTGLNDIKPEMLAEATQNARKAAVEFTRDSDVRLGSLRKASQGLFTIVDRDAALSAQSEGGYYGGGASDIFKKIRVVISVEYSIN